jgi:arylsulfatase A-like enzyme
MATPSGPKRNLLLLTIDAWRADFVDRRFGVELTPTLQSLASHTLRFDRAYTSGPWTSPGILSLFTGETALAHGVWHEWSALPPGRLTLPGGLAASGYQLPNLCYLNRVGNYHNLGYDPAASPGYPTGPDDDLLLRALRELPASPSAAPWFAWYHYKYVHLPYWAAPQYRRQLGIDDAALPDRVRNSVAKLFVVPRGEHVLLPEDREIVQRLYAASVRHMDDFLARVVTTLRETGQLANTTIVLTADHGDELLEHGHVGHASTAHYATLHEEVLRIPLLMIDPRIKTPRRSQARVWLPDLLPTLLAIGQAPTVGSPASARDLSPLFYACLGDGDADADALDRELTQQTAERRLVFHSSRRGYQTPRSQAGQYVCAASDGRRKYIYENYETPRRMLFDLQADPEELQPLTSGPAVDAAHAELLALCQGVAL